MTSGIFRSTSIDSIQKRPRQRKALGDLNGLATSIASRGLIHPVTIDRDGYLVTGERRLEACRSLGWTAIQTQFIDEVDPEVLHAIELEENVKRLNLTWQEECEAVADYHAFRVGLQGDWSLGSTATELGMATSAVSERISVAKSLSESIVAQAPKYSTALGIVKRANERRAAASIALLAEPEPEQLPSSIIQGDFHAWAKTYQGPRFNFIHCDFPYGIGADNRKQGSNQWREGGYADTEKTYWSLLETFAETCDAWCAPSAHIVFWFSMHYYQATLTFLAKRTNFVIDPFPLVWVKSDNMGLLPDAARGPRRIYETALFGARGDRKVVRSVSNAVSAPTSREIHMSEKPYAVLAHFFRMFVDEHTSILDPTCGSATALRVAKALGAPRCLGLEIDPEYVRRAREKENG